ncbi:MAG TPA: biopolymer transporter ExbD [Candidatus Sulfotelmatobacter sp.]|nr:biopolymer transporter ExbD [Candidatus Sulfotelmatobacter sp.]
MDATGVAGVFFFFVAMYLVTSAPNHDLSGHGVDLASAVHAKPLPGALKEDAITVVLSRDGRVYFGDTRVPTKELPGFIRKAYQNGSERKVYLRADARAKYGEVKAVLDQISAAGIQNVAFMVEGPPHATR